MNLIEAGKWLVIRRNSWHFHESKSIKKICQKIGITWFTKVQSHPWFTFWIRVCVCTMKKSFSERITLRQASRQSSSPAFSRHWCTYTYMYRDCRQGQSQHLFNFYIKECTTKHCMHVMLKHRGIPCAYVFTTKGEFSRSASRRCIYLRNPFVLSSLFLLFDIFLFWLFLFVRISLFASSNFVSIVRHSKNT